MKSMILDALSKLNADNDDHWTAEGSPKVGVVRSFAADNELTREDIESAAPGFSRSNTELPMFSDPEKLMTVPVDQLGEDEKSGLVKHLKTDLVNKQAAHEKLLAQMNALREQMLISNRGIEGVESKINELDPPPTNRDAIRTYLDRQQKDREDAWKKAQEAKAVPQFERSPLDRSFQRANRRANFAVG